MSLWLIGSVGVWAGVWFHGSTSQHYCADSGSKRISTVQTRAPNYLIYSRWQQPYWDVFASLFYSGRYFRRFYRPVVHLFYSLWFRRSFKEKCPLSGTKTQVKYVNPGTILLHRYRYILLCFYYVATEMYCGGSEFKYPGSVPKS